MRLKQFARQGIGLLRRVAKPHAQGFVDAVVHQEWVVGWAHDPRRPLRRLEVAVLDGPDLVASGIADLPRKDLAAAQIGDGRYGFRIRLPAHLLRGEPRMVTVCALTEKGRAPLERGRLTIGEHENVATPRAQISVGMMERVSGGKLHGWAYNPGRPDGPALIDVYDDERFLGSVIADRGRPHLREKGLPAAVRGFIFELDAPPDAMMLRRLRARLANTTHDLQIADNFLEQSDVAEQESLPAVTEAMPVPLSAEEEAVPDRIALILAEGSIDKRGQTLASWSAQNHAHLALAISGSPHPAQQAGDVLWLAPDARSSLEALLASSQYVCLARPGEIFDSTFAATLATLRGFPDIVSLDRDDTAIASFLARPPIRAFAVRGFLLLRYPGDLIGELRQGLLHGIQVWLANEPGLRWFGLDMPVQGDTGRMPPPDDMRRQIYTRALTGQGWAIRLPTPEGAPLLWPERQPASLSIGVWRGWERPGLPGLAALLADNFQGPIEVLVPLAGEDSESDARLAAARALCADNPAATCRLIDVGLTEAATCEALARAATHEMLILLDTGVSIDRGELREVLGWATHPLVGAVGINPIRPDDNILAGGLTVMNGQLHPSTHKRAALVHAVPPRFLVIATRKLAAGLDEEREGWDSLTLGLRLKQFGFSSLALGHIAATAAPELTLETPRPLPWQVAARLRAAGLMP